MALAAVYHLAALAVPAFRAIAYPTTYPVWRHVVFVLLDLMFAWLLIRRPIWLVWPFLALTIQVFAGHGISAWLSFREPGPIDWISVVVVIAVALTLILVFVDWLDRRGMSVSD